MISWRFMVEIVVIDYKVGEVRFSTLIGSTLVNGSGRVYVVDSSVSSKNGELYYRLTVRGGVDGNDSLVVGSDDIEGMLDKGLLVILWESN